MEPPWSVDVRILDRGRAIGGTWTPTAAERAAAWEVVVELVTRVPVIPLREDEGLLEEALGSLHSLFGEVRAILRRHGPQLASHQPGELSFAILAGVLLNQVLRPTLAYWHTRLSAHVDGRDPAVETRLQRERSWDELAALQRALDELRAVLVQFARCFAEASGTTEFVRTQTDAEDRQYDPERRRRAQRRADGS
jgi:hypothetical protein